MLIEVWENSFWQTFYKADTSINMVVSIPLMILSGPSFWKMFISEWTFDFGEKSDWTYSFWVDLEFFLYSEWIHLWIYKNMFVAR